MIESYKRTSSSDNADEEFVEQALEKLGSKKKFGADWNHEI